MKAKGTAVYTRQHFAGPTLAQQSAIDLLVCGKSDTETAAALGLSRTTVSKWRLYDVAFQAALNRRRAEVWSEGAERLRSLVPKALDALAAELDRRPNRLKAALALLKMAEPPAIGPSEPDAVLAAIVEARRQAARGVFQELMDDGKGLPPFPDHVEQVRQELAEKLAVPDDGDAGLSATEPGDLK